MIDPAVFVLARVSVTEGQQRPTFVIEGEVPEVAAPGGTVILGVSVEDSTLRLHGVCDRFRPGRGRFQPRGRPPVTDITGALSTIRLVGEPTRFESLQHLGEALGQPRILTPESAIALMSFAARHTSREERTRLRRRLSRRPRALPDQQAAPPLDEPRSRLYARLTDAGFVTFAPPGEPASLTWCQLSERPRVATIVEPDADTESAFRRALGTVLALRSRNPHPMFVEATPCFLLSPDEQRNPRWSAICADVGIGVLGVEETMLLHYPWPPPTRTRELAVTQRERLLARFRPRDPIADRGPLSTSDPRLEYWGRHQGSHVLFLDDDSTCRLAFAVDVGGRLYPYDIQRFASPTERVRAMFRATGWDPRLRPPSFSVEDNWQELAVNLRQRAGGPGGTLSEAQLEDAFVLVATDNVARVLADDFHLEAAKRIGLRFRTKASRDAFAARINRMAQSVAQGA